MDGSPGAGGRAGLDDLTQQHEEGDDAGGLESARQAGALALHAVIARDRAGQDAQGDQLVDGEEAFPEVFEGHHHDGAAEDDRTDHGAEGRDGGAAIEEPVHRERVQHEDQTDDRRGELGVGV